MSAAELVARIQAALSAEEGVTVPRSAATDVFLGVLVALVRTDERWREQGRGGVPSVTDYAADASQWLRSHYLRAAEL